MLAAGSAALTAGIDATATRLAAQARTSRRDRNKSRLDMTEIAGGLLPFHANVNVSSAMIARCSSNWSTIASASLTTVTLRRRR